MVDPQPRAGETEKKMETNKPSGDPWIADLMRLLRWSYERVEGRRKGTTVCTDFDPAGSTYEFTEAQESIDIRQLLGIDTEPSGL